MNLIIYIAISPSNVEVLEERGDVIQATAVIGGWRLIPHLWLTLAVRPKMARSRLSHGFA